MGADIRAAAAPGPQVWGVHSVVVGRGDAEVLDDVEEDFVRDDEVAFGGEGLDGEVFEEVDGDGGAVDVDAVAVGGVCVEALGGVGVVVS